MSPQAGMPWAPTEHVPGEGLDDDPTPRGVVRAVLEASMPVLIDVIAGTEIVLGLPRTVHRIARMGSMETRRLDAAHPLRVVGVGSGYGCWESELARWWVEALGLPRSWLHITAIEINPEREPHLCKWCDEVCIGDWREVLGWLHAIGREFDIVIMNPPFLELLRENGEFPRMSNGELQPARTMLPLLLRMAAPAVLALHTQQAFLRGEMGRAVQRMCPPAASWQIPGPVSFREDGKSDARCYEATLWLRDHTGPCSRYLLPELSSQDRRWTVPPGSEWAEWARANGYPLAPGVA